MHESSSFHFQSNYIDIWLCHSFNVRHAFSVCVLLTLPQQRSNDISHTHRSSYQREHTLWKRNASNAIRVRTHALRRAHCLFVIFSSHYSHLVIVPFDSHEWENLTYRRIHIRKCQTRWNEELTHSKREDKNRKINKTHFGIYRNVDEVTFLDFIHWLTVRGIWI